MIAPIFVLVTGTLEGFGRFGFAELPQAPGLVLEGGGVRPDRPGGEWLRFVRPLGEARAVDVTRARATFLVSGGSRQPGKLRVNLWSPGLELHFTSGAAFDSSFAGQPFLTWAEGSVGPGVSTPPTPWVVVSYPAPQPPVLLASLGEPIAWEWSGGPGAWTLRSQRGWQGWLRIALPAGIRVVTTSVAADLGSLADRVQANAPYWTGPSPTMLAVDARDVPGGLMVVWRFDRAGAVAPIPISLARRGGFPLDVRSAVRHVQAPTREGPTLFAAEPRLAVFLPSRPIPPGRAVTLGRAEPPRGPFSPLNAQNLPELALGALLAANDSSVTHQASGMLADFLAVSLETTVRNSGLRVPTGPRGASNDLLAAHALLEAALAHAHPWGSQRRALGDGLMAAFDNATWTLPDFQTARLLGLARMLDTDPIRRAEGAMLAAGWAAARARPGWISEHGLGDARSVTSPPSEGWPDGLLAGPPPPWASPLRVLSGQTVLASQSEGGVRLRWFDSGQTPGELWLHSSATLAPMAGAGLLWARLEPSAGPVVHYQALQPGWVELMLPWTAPALPASAANPR